jgi:hypothetical protein
MPTVAITVDCEAANENRCFTPQIVKIAEEFMIPITWLIYVSEKSPTSNTDLYYREYFHRIPSWHEIGLHVHFENSSGYVDNEKTRGEIIRIGKDVLKARLVKPTAFRAGDFALLPSDLKYLEDIGIVADSSPVPDSEFRPFVDWTGAPKQPYHPDYADARKQGSAKLMCVPVSVGSGQPAYLDREDAIRDVVENQAVPGAIVCIGMTDWDNHLALLRDTIAALKAKGAKFRCLTDVAAERMI